MTVPRVVGPTRQTPSPQDEAPPLFVRLGGRAKLDELGCLVQVSDLTQWLLRAGLVTECGPVHKECNE